MKLCIWDDNKKYNILINFMWVLVCIKKQKCYIIYYNKSCYNFRDNKFHCAITGKPHMRNGL